MRRFAALVFVSLVAAGCMGGGDEGVSREDYVAKADGVCGTYQVRLSRIPRPVTAEPAELGAYLERALPIAREQHEELTDLPRPEGDDRDQIDQLLGLLEQELDFNEAAQRAAGEGDRATLDSQLQQGAAVSAEAGQLAEQLGFVVCARRA
jgi:hypothetical protein